MHPQENPTIPLSAAAQDAAGTPQAAQPTSSKLMGIWRLGEQLAGGRQWQLWAAQPADAAGSPRWDYALRMVPRDGASASDREAAVERLRRTAEAAAQVRHPQLLSVIDASLEGAEPFIVMPRLAGRSLADVLAAGTSQPLPVVLWFVRQAAQAGAALHEAGLVHGNLMPENVLVSPQGQAMVLGLGSARRLRHVPAEPQPAAEPTLGTQREVPHAAAPRPESTAAEAEAAASAEDVLALGRLLWQLLYLVDQERAPQGSFEAAAELVADLIHPEPTSRPTCEQLIGRLAELETLALGQLICPADNGPLARAA